MNKKILFLTGLIILVLFSGCIQQQKLSEQELEEKAKEYFYSLPDKDMEGFPVKTTDFVIVEKKFETAKDYKIDCDYYCNKFKDRYNCSINAEDCKAYEGTIYSYKFEPNPEIKEKLLRNLIWVEGFVILKDNGKPIYYYLDGFYGDLLSVKEN